MAIPYMQNISGKIRILLTEHNIETIHQQVKKSNLLRSAKDSLRYNMLGISCIPCDCESVCRIGQCAPYQLGGKSTDVTYN
jgi:hypothetical protein